MVPAFNFHESNHEEAFHPTQSMSCWHRVLRDVTPMFAGTFRRFPFGQSVIRTKLLPNQNLAKELQVARANNGNLSANNHQRNRAAHLILENPVCVSRPSRSPNSNRPAIRNCPMRLGIAKPRQKIALSRHSTAYRPMHIGQHGDKRQTVETTRIELATSGLQSRALPVELRPRGAVPNHSTRRNRSQFSNEMRTDLPTSGVRQMP